LIRLFGSCTHCKIIWECHVGLSMLRAMC